MSENYLVEDVTDNTLVISSHESDEDNVVWGPLELSTVFNSSEYNKIQFCVPIQLNPLKDFSDDVTVIRFKLRFWYSSTEKFYSILYVRKDSTNGRYYLQVRNRELVGSDYEDGHFYFDVTTDVVFWVVNLISEADNYITEESCCSTGLNWAYASQHCSVTEGVSFIDEVTLEVSSLSSADEPASIIMSNPWYRYWNDTTLQVVSTYDPIPLDGADWTQWENNSLASFPFIQLPGRSSIVPIDWQTMIEFENTLEYQQTFDTVNDDLLEAAVLLAVHRADFLDKIGSTSDSENCTGNVLQRLLCIINKIVALVDTIITSPKLWVRNLVYKLFDSIESDNPTIPFQAAYNWIDNQIQENAHESIKEWIQEQYVPPEE